MNLHEQLGALEMGVDQLIQTVVAPQGGNVPETPAETAASHASVHHAVDVESRPERERQDSHETATAGNTEPHVVDRAAPEAPDTAAQTPAERPILSIGRPSQNEISVTIGGKSISLHPEQVGQLIEELANARASMTPEPPMGMPRGWRFVSTKNPVMAVQKQSNGDRTLVMRHTGHGWVPFTFSPDIVIQMYMLLTQR